MSFIFKYADNSLKMFCLCYSNIILVYIDAIAYSVL